MERSFTTVFEPFSAKLKIADKIGQIEIADEETEKFVKMRGVIWSLRGRYGKFLACPVSQNVVIRSPFLLILVLLVPNVRVVNWLGVLKGRKFLQQLSQCDFVSWDEPVNRKCPQCGQILLLKKSKKEGIKYICSSKDCQFTQKAGKSDEQH